MDIDRLIAFQTLAKTQHFRKASEQLHISTPTLSRMIQALESDLGCILFERNKRHVQLSSQGHHFLTYANTTVSQWHDIKSTLTQPDLPLKGQIRIFCSVTASYGVLPPFIQQFRKVHPLIQVTLTTGSSEHVINKVLDDDADIGICTLTDHPPPQLTSKKVLDIPLTLIQHDSQTIDWAHSPYLLPEPGTVRSLIDTWLHTATLNPSTIFEHNSFESILSLVSAGYGIGIIPQIVLDQSPLHTTIQTPTPPMPLPSLPIGICTLTHKLKWPHIHSFWACCTNASDI